MLKIHHIHFLSYLYLRPRHICVSYRMQKNDILVIPAEMEISTTKVETTILICPDSISISGDKNGYLKHMEILGVVELLNAGYINWTAK